MSMVNPFTGTGYDLQALTAAINILPNLYGRLNKMNLFPFRGVPTTTVSVEQLNGTLNIARSRQRGAPADFAIADKRELRTFQVPYIPVDDVLLPQDFQNIRAFGSESEAQTQAGIVQVRLQKMRNILDQTLEYLRMGALKGIILDADGTTLYNLYTQFGISAKTVDFALDDEDTEVANKCSEVLRHIEVNLKGEQMSGVRALVSSGFYDALVTHPKVEKAFANYLVNGQNLAGDYRKSFRYGGIVFEEYVATWTDKDGTARPAIAANEAHFFPEGTLDTFQTVVSPGNFMETANTIGLPYYARQEAMDFGQGIKFHAESNVLPICARPAILVKGTI